MVPKAHYSTTATKKGSMSFVVGVDILKPELVLLVTAGRPGNLNTCGNEADKHIKAMGYILVQ